MSINIGQMSKLLSKRMEQIIQSLIVEPRRNGSHQFTIPLIDINEKGKNSFLFTFLFLLCLNSLFCLDEDIQSLVVL